MPLLEDLVVCAYALCEDDSYEIEEYADCIPEALYTLHNIAVQLGIKIRFSTVSALINHVVEFNKLKEQEVIQLINNLKKIIQGENTQPSTKSLLKILLKKELDLPLKEQDLNEIAIAALYASLTKTINKTQEHPPLLEAPTINQETIATIT
ncbi:MAG: hypothetical protein QW775_06255 [Ignisphaera sp.]